MASQVTTIALAGNPNVGKSTLFNAMTGAHQHVGNWPGKTVEKKEGRFEISGRDVALVDLPGTYSLAAYSVEEIIARDFIVSDHPDLVIAVVDASNLERNLYLVTQIMELNTPLLLALNMSDVARSRGLTIDTAALARGLGGIPVIETVGNRGLGVEILRQAINGLVASGQASRPVPIPYSDGLEAEIKRLEGIIGDDPGLAGQYNSRWLAIKLLENDPVVTESLRARGSTALVQAAADAIARVTATFDDDPETLLTDGRYRFISAVVKGAVTRPNTTVETRSDRVDRIVTHRLWGVPIFLALMWLVFQFTATVSGPYVDWIDGVVNGPLARLTAGLIAALGLQESPIRSLVVNGMLAGVGNVLVFVPVLLFLYLSIAVLEDSGYMARAAFVMDRVMRAIGLHGKSFLPLLIGFGCTVPAVYATRTLENPHDRRLTAFLATFMSCGARLPVYAVIGAAFFGVRAGSLIFGLYILGIAVALLTGFVAKRTVYKNLAPQPFVMELPPYRLPNLKGMLIQTWERTRGFLVKAATVILPCTVVIWLLMAIPARPGVGSFDHVEPKDSLFGTISHVVSPVFAPAGFGTWQASAALLTGVLAKEVVVSTMAQIYASESAVVEPGDVPAVVPVDELRTIGVSFVQSTVLTLQAAVNIVPRTLSLVPGVHIADVELLHVDAETEDLSGLQSALVAAFTPLAAVAFSVFVLLYVPCMTAVSAMRQEFGRRMMAYQIVYTMAIAWVGAVLVFQVGRLLGLGV